MLRLPAHLQRQCVLKADQGKPFVPVWNHLESWQLQLRPPHFRSQSRPCKRKTRGSRRTKKVGVQTCGAYVPNVGQVSLATASTAFVPFAMAALTCSFHLSLRPTTMPRYFVLSGAAMDCPLILIGGGAYSFSVQQKWISWNLSRSNQQECVRDQSRSWGAIRSSFSTFSSTVRDDTANIVSSIYPVAILS